MESRTTITAETKPQSVRQALCEGAERLNLAGVESARLDAEVLLADILGMEKAELYLKLEAMLREEDEKEFRRVLARRARREPVAYITGRKEFWSRDFLVTAGVLIPRPETERLVEVVLERAHAFAGKAAVEIADLGTGSGAIAVSLAKELPQATITAVDVSAAALEVARRNTERHGVARRIRLLRGDLFEPLAGQFDFIVSNPPYVRRGEWAALPVEIRAWEPLAALDGGIDGLDCYRRIIAVAEAYLAPEGQIVLEIGADMSAAIADLLRDAGGYTPASVYRDYSGKDRVMAATKRPPANWTVKGLNCG